MPEKVQRLHCTICQKVTTVTYDSWEDCYMCQDGYHMLLPEDIGRATDTAAGVFHIGESPKNAQS